MHNCIRTYGRGHAPSPCEARCRGRGGERRDARAPSPSPFPLCSLPAAWLPRRSPGGTSTRGRSKLQLHTRWGVWLGWGRPVHGALWAPKEQWRRPIIPRFLVCPAAAAASAAPCTRAGMHACMPWRWCARWTTAQLGLRAACVGFKFLATDRRAFKPFLKKYYF